MTNVYKNRGIAHKDNISIRIEYIMLKRKVQQIEISRDSTSIATQQTLKKIKLEIKYKKTQMLRESKFCMHVGDNLVLVK
jgi:uncharacterized protein YdcH (DUF465 family)